MKIKNLNLIKISFFTVLTALIILAFLFYRHVFSYIVVSLVFAYLLNPIVKFIKRKKINRTLSIIIVYLCLIVSLIVILLIIIPMLFDQIKSFSTEIMDFIQNADVKTLKTKLPVIDDIQSRINDVAKKFPILNLNQTWDQVLNNFMQWVSDMPSTFIDYLGNILTILSFIATIPIIGFFILKDQNKFKKAFLNIIPNRYFELIIILMEKIDEIVGKYFRAMMIEILIVGILSAISLSILGVKFSLAIGITAGFANAIPYFGPLIGIILAIISVLLTAEPPIMIINVIIAMQLVQLVDNNIVYPIVMGRNTDMHPLLILLTVIAGGYTYGIMGMFLSVPIVFLIKETVRVLYKNLKEFEII